MGEFSFTIKSRHSIGYLTPHPIPQKKQQTRSPRCDRCDPHRLGLKVLQLLLHLRPLEAWIGQRSELGGE